MHLRHSLAAVLTAGALLTAAGCGGSAVNENTAGDTTGSSPSTGASSGAAGAGTKGTVRISGQDFPEAELVADMYEQLLAKAGYDPQVKLVGSRSAYLGIFPKSIDVVPEYVGGLVNQLNTDANGAKAKPFEAGDGQQLAQDGKQLLDDKGITLLDESSATDANAFFVTKQYASDNGLTNLSDLSGKSVVLAAASDCAGRLDCAGGLTDQYGIKITKLLGLGYASDQTYQSVINGESQLGETSTTDGTLDSQGLVILNDDKMIQPAQNLVPAVSTSFLDAHPDVADVLNPLMAALTTDKLTQLNAEISVNREKPADVASQFLQQAGLL
jgi:osmoprotectant transport system substrate-binding protein